VATDTLTASEVDLDRLAVDTVCVLPWTPSTRPAAGIRARPGRWSRPPMLLWTRFQEHAPDLLASTRVGEAEEGRAVVSTINRNSGTISRHQPDKHQPGQHKHCAGALARYLPETALRVT
jgi:hypothetical protein